MKLIIQDKFKGIAEIKDPQFIPRIGDRVEFGYLPAPRVSAVLIDYDADTISVALD